MKEKSEVGRAVCLVTATLALALIAGSKRSVVAVDVRDRMDQHPAATAVAESPERRALSYLAREVPLWSAEHKCFSCHNNGDGARALYRATRLSYSVPRESLAATTRWLERPEDWEHNKGEPGFSDKGLARIQFGAALVEAFDCGLVRSRSALARAAELIATGQKEDGSWQIDAPGALGSPVTYGTCLATVTARRVLSKAGSEQFATQIGKADRWLRTAAVETVLDAAAVLLGLDRSKDLAPKEQADHCLNILRRGQSREGGWGPHVKAAPEPFDTAVALLALSTLPLESDVTAMVQRGRAFLISIQLPDGSWPETTRPPRSESYAQRISTAGWATLALLATNQQ